MSEIVRALIAMQQEDGWLAPERLRTLAERLRVPLHRIESLSTYYTHFRRTPPNLREVAICRDLSCRLAGSASTREELARWAKEQGDTEIREVSCLGRCDAAPAAALAGEPIDASELGGLPDRLEQGGWRRPTRIAHRWPTADPYAGGELAPYAILRGALSGGVAPILSRLETAGLRGMGGAGFPTAKKWSLVRAQISAPKHVVCNADESEPGTFKDRDLLYDLPHLVIEGIALGALCVGAERGTLFIRHEYEPERRRLEAAIEDARASGALGSGIFGSRFSFDLDIFVSPGGYVLGEETALLECMEGRRGEPRNKPPFPGTRGLFGRPTLINNVETLVHAVGIAHWGADWWRSLGRRGFSGHKFMAVSGDVSRPGVELVPFGTTLAELLDRVGGMKDGASLLAVAPGGASSSWLDASALGLPLDFAALERAGSMLGSGAAVFVAEGRDLLDIGLNVAQFFRNESCGKCVPCRLGTEKAIARIEAEGGVSAESEDLLRSLDETLARTSLCGLGQVALGPLVSILDRFPDRVRRVETRHPEPPER